MIKTVGIVSLSKGILGEAFAKHELELGMKRLEDYGLKVKLLSHALKGIDYLEEHPEARAADLLEAFADDTIDLILCAIGGDDTYRLLPYLFENNQLEKVAKQKAFLGFSDTTMNHLMLHKVGVKTFYGQSFIADICELDKEMLPYSEHYFREFIQTGSISEIRPSDLWYEERQDFSENALGTQRTAHPNHGFELLRGPATFSGPILGGCLESLYDIFDHSRYPDTVELCDKYHLFPSIEDWRGKLLLLETSEEKPSPKEHRKMLESLKATGIFNVINGLLVGKPQNESHYQAYKENLLEVVDQDLPILYNLNVGHATPRAIVPFGIMAHVDAVQQVIRFAKEA